MTALDSTLSNFDGGGVGGTTNATAGATSSAVGGISSANPTLSTVLSNCATTSSAPSGIATTTATTSRRVGIPLGSEEIGNLGVSPLLGLPTTTSLDPVTSPLVALPTQNPLASAATSATNPLAGFTIGTPCSADAVGSNGVSTPGTTTATTGC
jgi:hypothetical protein